MGEIKMSLKDYLNLVKKPTRGPGVRKYAELRKEFEKNIGVPVSVVVQKVQNGEFTLYRSGS